ncbi:hypothetical protein [Sphingomonas sp.]
MPLKTGGCLLVDALLERGCDRIFSVPSETFLAERDTLRDIRAIAHHE